MSKLLIDEPPLQVLPTLAALVGLNEAILLQQLHYWLENPNVSGVESGGLKWIANTYEEWTRNFPFWSSRTIERLFTSLEKEGLVESVQVGKKNWDRRKCYRIAYDGLQSRQIRGFEDANLAPSETPNPGLHIHRLQTETTAETTGTPFIPLKGNEKKRSGFVVPSLDEVTEYAFEIGMTAGDGESFHDHFTANGWKVGKGGLPMKDWKAAMRNWKRNAAKFSQTVQKKETFEERMVRLGLA